MLQSLTPEKWGVAYIHYTRYRLLNQIANQVGLHINRPSEAALVGGMRLTYSALCDWASVNIGSFNNEKGLIVECENIRQQFHSKSQHTLTSEQLALLRHLDALATDPNPTLETHPRSTGWSAMDLRRHILPYLRSGTRRQQLRR